MGGGAKAGHDLPVAAVGGAVGAHVKGVVAALRQGLAVDRGAQRLRAGLGARSMLREEAGMRRRCRAAYIQSDPCVPIAVCFRAFQTSEIPNADSRTEQSTRAPLVGRHAVRAAGSLFAARARSGAVAAGPHGLERHGVRAQRLGRACASWGNTIMASPHGGRAAAISAAQHTAARRARSLSPSIRVRDLISI